MKEVQCQGVNVRRGQCDREATHSLKSGEMVCEHHMRQWAPSRGHGPCCSLLPNVPPPAPPEETTEPQKRPDFETREAMLLLGHEHEGEHDWRDGPCIFCQQLPSAHYPPTTSEGR